MSDSAITENKRRYKRRIKRLVAKRNVKINNNVVTVIKYDGIGDFVLFLDAARGLRNLYANKKIVLSCPNNVKEMAERSGCFDEVVVFAKGEFALKNIKKARQKAHFLDCELLLHLSFSRDYTAEVLTSFVTANKKISVPYTGIFSEQDKAWAESLYDEFLDIPLDAMSLQQNKLVLQALGATEFFSRLPVLPALPEDVHLYLPENYYVLFIGGSEPFKKWSIANYYALAEYIGGKTDCTCVLAGIDEDIPQVEFFNNGNVRFYSYVDKTNLDELQFLLSRAKFVIGNDTSAIHMAVALGVPALAITSAVASNRFYPYVVDDINGKHLPLFIKKDCDCKGCSFSPSTYLRCLATSSKIAPAKCIEQIQLNETVKKVDILLNNIKQEKKL